MRPGGKRGSTPDSRGPIHVPFAGPSNPISERLVVWASSSSLPEQSLSHEVTIFAAMARRLRSRLKDSSIHAVSLANVHDGSVAVAGRGAAGLPHSSATGRADR